MVSVLFSKSSGPGLSTGQGHCKICVLGLDTFSASLHPYKWVLANLMLGVTLQWTSIPSRGGGGGGGE